MSSDSFRLLRLCLAICLLLVNISAASLLNQNVNWLLGIVFVDIILVGAIALTDANWK